MENRTKILLVILAITVSFAAGRWSVSNPDTKVTEVTKVDEKKELNTDTHSKRMSVTVEEPSGKKTTTTVVDSDTSTKIKDDKKTNSQVSTEVTQAKHKTLNISALAGYQLPGTLSPVYGVSINKEVLGPVTVGAYWINNGTIGLSLGLDF